MGVVVVVVVVGAVVGGVVGVEDVHLRVGGAGRRWVVAVHVEQLLQQLTSGHVLAQGAVAVAVWLSPVVFRLRPRLAVGWVSWSGDQSAACWTTELREQGEI